MTSFRLGWVLFWLACVDPSGKDPLDTKDGTLETDIPDTESTDPPVETDTVPPAPSCAEERIGWLPFDAVELASWSAPSTPEYRDDPKGFVPDINGDGVSDYISRFVSQDKIVSYAIDWESSLLFRPSMLPDSIYHLELPYSGDRFDWAVPWIDLDGDGKLEKFIQRSCGAACLWQDDPPYFGDDEERITYDVFYGTTLGELDPSHPDLSLVYPNPLLRYVIWSGVHFSESAGELDGTPGRDIVLGSYMQTEHFDYEDPLGYLPSGRIEVHRGPFTAGAYPLRTPVATIETEELDARLGQSLAVADVDQDGFDDVITSWINPVGGGEVLIFLGPLSGTLEPSDAGHVIAAAPSFAGNPGIRLLVEGVKDTDGDGWPDLLLSEAWGQQDLAIDPPVPEGVVPTDVISLVPGPLLAVVSSDDARWRVSSGDQPYDVGRAQLVGDLDGDGSEEAAIPVYGLSPYGPDGCPGDTGLPAEMCERPTRSSIVVMWGTSTGDAWLHEAPVRLYEEGGDAGSLWVLGPGDLDGDGRAEFAGSNGESVNIYSLCRGYPSP